MLDTGWSYKVMGTYGAAADLLWKPAAPKLTRDVRKFQTMTNHLNLLLLHALASYNKRNAPAPPVSSWFGAHRRPAVAGGSQVGVWTVRGRLNRAATGGRDHSSRQPALCLAHVFDPGMQGTELFRRLSGRSVSYFVVSPIDSSEHDSVSKMDYSKAATNIARAPVSFLRRMGHRRPIHRTRSSYYVHGAL